MDIIQTLANNGVDVTGVVAAVSMCVAIQYVTVRAKISLVHTSKFATRAARYQYFLCSIYHPKYITILLNITVFAKYNKQKPNHKSL